jgi:hypothetical protein
MKLLDKIIRESLIATIERNLREPHKSIYLSGPITGIEGYNKIEFENYEKHFSSQGYHVINPHKLTEGIDTTSWTWEMFMTIDIPFLLLCAEVVVLPGWQNSKGARLEISNAFFLNKKLFYGLEKTKMDLHFYLDYRTT